MFKLKRTKQAILMQAFSFFLFFFLLLLLMEHANFFYHMIFITIFVVYIISYKFQTNYRDDSLQLSYLLLSKRLKMSHLVQIRYCYLVFNIHVINMCCVNGK